LHLRSPLLVEAYSGELDGAVERYSIGDSVKTFALMEEDGFGEKIAEFRVLSSISSDAFANLIGQSSQVGMSSQRISPENAERLARAGAGDMTDPSNEHVLALDSLVVVTHPSNPVKSISMEDLRGIYSGRISNWSEIGGEDAPIKVVNRLSGTATQSVFEDLVFADGANGVPTNSTVVSSFKDVTDTVRADEHALAYVPYADQRGTAPVDLISECGIAMSPDAFSARTGEYDLGRFLYLYTRNDTILPTTKDFIDFVSSPVADSVVRKAGFIDLGVTRQEQAMDSFRARNLLTADGTRSEASTMRDMLATMLEYDRLSSTFRFQTGSDRLTERGQLDLERLVAYAKTLPSGTELMFVGFTDSVGEFSNNMALSEFRAQSVRNAFARASRGQLDGITLATQGFGEVSPSACNTTDAGKTMNRRVEVWIKSESNA